MPNFGLSTIPTEYTIQPAELGRWLEAQGFESVWFGEHSHIPVSRQSPYVAGGELPEYYKHFFDPFIGLSAVAAVTESLKLGTSICLVTVHHPIGLAKQIACLDRIANGRVLIGVGAGWNAEEMADYGVAFADRWKVTREWILAMREIWTKEIAEYHGAFVNFDAMWCWPKPVQPAGPRVLMGASSKFAPARIAEYCDGWIPTDTGGDLTPAIDAVRVEVERRGRSFKEMDLTILSDIAMVCDDGLPARMRELFKMGFNRVLFRLPAGNPDAQWPLLERYGEIIRSYR